MTETKQISGVIFLPCDLITASVETSGVVSSEIQLLPMGRFVAKDGRGPWIVRDAAHAKQIIKASLDHAGQSQIAIDYDHQLITTAKTGGVAPAAGWVTAMDVRDDGIWAKVDWTPRAREQLAQREYRYLSPVFSAHRTTGAVHFIANAALTNVPALDLQAVASRQESTTMNDETALRIRALLGLGDGVNDAAVITAITNLTAAVIRMTGNMGGCSDGSGAGNPKSDTTACASTVPSVPSGVMAAMAHRLAVSEASAMETNVQAMVRDGMRNGQVSPAMKDWALTTCRNDFEGFQQFLKVAPQIVRLSSTSAVPPLTKRDPNGLSDNQLAVCRTLNLTPSAFAQNLQDR